MITIPENFFWFSGERAKEEAWLVWTTISAEKDKMVLEAIKIKEVSQTSTVERAGSPHETGTAKAKLSSSSSRSNSRSILED